MSPTSSTASSTSVGAGAAAATASKSAIGNETTFLTLLVSQLKNQDPLNPADSTQFVSQLTSYSQLEQLINIDKNTTPATSATAASGTTPATNKTTTGS